MRHPQSSSTARSAGQSLVELALVLPVFLFIVLIGLDFGRVYSGWVTLQQASRLAADYAAINWQAWQGTGIAIQKTAYQSLIQHETLGINCDLPNPAPDPTFTDLDGNGLGPGDAAFVQLDCQFHILTPIISAVLSNVVHTSASSTFPIKTGDPTAWNGNPGGGGPSCQQSGTCPLAPIANFSTLPVQNPPPITTVSSGQNVQFIDSTQGTPTSWLWDFGDNSAVSANEFPVHTYTNTGITTLTFTVHLTACNLGGCSSATGTIQVLSPTPPPASAFHWCTTSSSNCSPQSPTPLIGQLTVWFFDTSSGTPTSWSWNFGDGGTSTLQNPSHVFAAVGTSTVRTITLTATNASGSNTATAQLTIDPPCLRTAPFFLNTSNPLGPTTGPNKGKWTTTDLTTVWTNTSAQYNAAHPGSNFSWTGGGFSGGTTYVGSQPGSGVYFKVVSPSPTPAGGTPSLPCTTSLTGIHWQ